MVLFGISWLGIWKYNQRRRHFMRPCATPYHVIPASGNELGNGPSLPLLVSLPLPPFPPILIPRPILRHNAYSFKESDDKDYHEGQRRCNQVSYCRPSHMGGYDQGMHHCSS